MAEPGLEMSIDDGLVHIVFTRPQNANTLTPEIGFALRAAVDRAEREGVRAYLISAQGPMFCAGGDLRGTADAADPSVGLREMIGEVHGVLNTLAASDAPLVVAVQGVAAGVGLSFVAAADLVIASEQASFVAAYTRAGLTPDGGLTYNLPRIVGHRRAAELILTNRSLNATEALDWGLVNAVVPAGALYSAAETLARRLAAGPTGAFGAVRQLLGKSFGATLTSQLDAEAKAIIAAVGSANGREGVRAFVEKREASFGH